MEAYLDNSATTRCCEEAAQLVVKLLTEDYGNPSSMHRKGVEAEKYIKEAIESVIAQTYTNWELFVIDDGSTDRTAEIARSYAEKDSRIILHRNSHNMGTAKTRNTGIKLAKTLKVQEKEICFTSGGTESNNLAIIGVAEANKRSGKHVITTSIEHPSVSATMAYLEEHGYDYDEMVWSMINGAQKTGGDDGTQ